MKTRKNKHIRHNKTQKHIFKYLTKIPGYNEKLKSKMIASHIHLPNTEKYLHYWFIQCEKSPETAPLFFWTNGGPGCSSLIGLFEEIGPFKIKENLEVEYNPLTWAKFANVVYLEHPVGVGFSYSNLKKDYINNDKIDSQDNLSFTIEFFKLFSNFKKNKLYICGESYAGHYVPLWVKEIINYNKNKDIDKINLKGFILMNPYLNYISGNEAQVETLWGHQKIPFHLWKTYKKKCRTNDLNIYQKNKCDSLSDTIVKVSGKINPYAIDYPTCVHSHAHRLLSHYTKNHKQLKYNYIPCDDTYTEQYLNSKKFRDFQKDLINDTMPFKVKWKACADYNPFKYSVKDGQVDLSDTFNSIILDESIKGLDILIMSGTNDSICGTIKTQSFLDNLKLNKIIKWKEYYVNEQISGYLVKYHGIKHHEQKKLYFTTINLAGHEIPMYKPKIANDIVINFLKNKL